ncbi:MAG TPA: sensor domain-containing diguanylate cyclase [Nitrolancea sp.]|nr:sensor domain-containing diguanylate cyclase [Nitrolancea sp.]
MVDIEAADASANSSQPLAHTPFEAVRDMLASDDPREAVRQTLIDLDQRSRPSITVLYDVVVDRFKPGQTLFSLNANLSPPALFSGENGLLSETAFAPWIDALMAGETVVRASHDLPTLDQLRVEAHGLRSLVIAPILLDHELRGVLVSARVGAVSTVSTDTRTLIELAAATISAALARRKSAGPRLRSDDRLTAILSYAFDTIVVLDRDGTILFHSPSFGGGGSRLFEDSNGENAFSFVHPQDLPRVRQVLGELLHEPGGMRAVEMRLQQTDGSWRYYDAIGTNQLDNPDINGIVVTAHDVTERKELEKQLNWQAFHDPLTKLANRSLLLNDLARALARIERSDEMVALLYIDIDGFKEVNDSLGHPVGDQLLILTGDRLHSSVRAGETVARLGGDEFVVLLEGLKQASDAERAAARILEALSVPVYLDSQPLAITSCVGISIAADRSVEPDEMLIEADTALYAAKREGRARYVCYSPALRRDFLGSARGDFDQRSFFTIS